jgi:hypothetical protein
VTPAGLVEELELERHAAAELEARIAALWPAPVAVRASLAGLRAELAEARDHIARLELALAGAVR